MFVGQSFQPNGSVLAPNARVLGSIPYDDGLFLLTVSEHSESVAATVAE